MSKDSPISHKPQPTPITYVVFVFPATVCFESSFISTHNIVKSGHTLLIYHSNYCCMLDIAPAFTLPCPIIIMTSLSSNILSVYCWQWKAMLFHWCKRADEDIAWAVCGLMLLSLFMVFSCYFHSFYTHFLFYFFLFLRSLCPNMCLALLFSLAIHCLTAEVFFQPFKSCTLKFPCQRQPGMRPLSSCIVCVHVVLEHRLTAASPLGFHYYIPFFISCVKTRFTKSN